jgi:phosphatidylserine/phosphatidylglycerophosphate/cardiolipin synthase-like enzyme
VALRTGATSTPNLGISGRVIGTGSPPAGIPGLTVAAYFVDAVGLLDDTLIDRDETTPNGDFSLGYNPYVFAPDLRVRVFDPVQRLLYVSPVFRDITDPVLTLPSPITLNRADVEGWLVTGGTGTPQMLTTGNTISALIDNAAAWAALTAAVKAATGSIRLLLHYFDVKNLFTTFAPPYSPTPKNFEGIAATGDRLEEALLAANRDFNVPVWLVVNDFVRRMYIRGFPSIFNDFPVPFTDTADKVEDYFSEQNTVRPHTVGVARFKAPQEAPMHAKIAVIEEPGRTRGFIPASGLIQEYFSDQSHRIDDPRRGTMVFLSNFIKAPVHDVSVMLEGPAVNDMDRTIRLHWDVVHPASPMPPLAPFPSPPPPTPSAVQVVRTLPADTFPAPLDQGETGILEAYQRAFLKAKDYIYIETQYFTEATLADSLILALRRRPALVAILLINIQVDVPFYNTWQMRLVQRFLAQVSSDGATSRVGVFTLWSHERTDTGNRIIRNYVHSKLALVDDQWATIGSANIEGTGLDRAQHVEWLLPESFRGVTRGVEANVVIFDGLDGLPASPFPRELRRNLWAEHLGFSDAAHPDLLNRPTATGGWLNLWATRADAKLVGLKEAPPSVHAARILKWQPHTDPVEYLKALGVNTSEMTVERRVRDFDLTTGIWK